MGKFIDLIGKNFGKWTVIGYKIYVYPSGRKEKHAVCKCECGSVAIIQKCYLVRNSLKTCASCYKKKYEKYIGEKIGDWIVLEVIRKKRLFIKCRCKCGKISLLTVHDLFKEYTRMCVDCRNNKNGEVLGKRFGKLLVIGDEQHNGKKMYKCKCDCGDLCFIYRQHLYKRKSCGCIGSYNNIQEIIDKYTELEGDCLIWKGAGDRYGKLEFKGKQYTTHRVSYELKYGKIPKGLQACHTCRNKKCCNPNHIYAGTAKQNSADKIKDGTHQEGESCPHHILSERQVLEIRRRYKEENISQRTIAKEYGVTRGAITGIVKRKTWKHLGD